MKIELRELLSCFIVCSLVKVTQSNGGITLSIQRHGTTALFRSQTSFLHLGQPHTAAFLAVRHDFYRQNSVISSNFPYFFQNEHFLDKYMLSQGIFIYKSSVLKTLKHTFICVTNGWCLECRILWEGNTLSMDFLITKLHLFLTLSFTFTLCIPLNC